MTQEQAIELAEQYLQERGGIGTFTFAYFIPAHSAKISDPKFPEDRWAVHFNTDYPGLHPNFFVLTVKCDAQEVVPGHVM